MDVSVTLVAVDRQGNKHVKVRRAKTDVSKTAQKTVFDHVHNNSPFHGLHWLLSGDGKIEFAADQDQLTGPVINTITTLIEEALATV